MGFFKAKKIIYKKKGRKKKEESMAYSVSMQIKINFKIKVLQLNVVLGSFVLDKIFYAINF